MRFEAKERSFLLELVFKALPHATSSAVQVQQEAGKRLAESGIGSRQFQAGGGQRYEATKLRGLSFDWLCH